MWLISSNYKQNTCLFYIYWRNALIYIPFRKNDKEIKKFPTSSLVAQRNCFLLSIDRFCKPIWPKKAYCSCDDRYALQLTAGNGALLYMLTVAHLAEKFRVFYVTQKFITTWRYHELYEFSLLPYTLYL